MCTAYRMPVTGFGTANRPRTRKPDGHQPGGVAQKRKAFAATRRNNGFLTERIHPIALDYYLERSNDTSMNLTTPESFDYLYQSAVNYARLLDVRLPFPKKSRSRYPRLDIVRLFEVMDNLVPESVNLEVVEDKLAFCLYRHHDWPDHTLFWMPLDFARNLSTPTRRLVLEFIRRFMLHHNMQDLKETYYYEMSCDDLESRPSYDEDITPREAQAMKKLVESYKQGRIDRMLKRMWKRPFCPGFSRQLAEYCPEREVERKLLALVKEGTVFIGKGVPSIMSYQYDWAHEEEPDFRPIPLYEQVMLVYSIRDALTENMMDIISSDQRETYSLSPVTCMRLSPQTDRLFCMDDFPERFARWFGKFTAYIEQHF